MAVQLKRLAPQVVVAMGTTGGSGSLLAAERDAKPRLLARCEDALGDIAEEVDQDGDRVAGFAAVYGRMAFELESAV